MMDIKPLNGKAYGSIPHLPGSKFGNRDDKGIDEKAAEYFTIGKVKTDRIIVLEKLDGSCVSVVNIKGEIIPLIRSGYRANSSKFKQHHLFHDWVIDNIDRFENIEPGQRICGEWLAQAHGTRYNLKNRDPLVVFDIFNGTNRLGYDQLMHYAAMNDLSFAPVLFYKEGEGCSIPQALSLLGKNGKYGALELAEGCVWRCERKVHDIIMMAKYVRPEKEPGKYLEGTTGKDAVWNIKEV